VQDFWAWAKKTQTPAKLAELEAWYKERVAPKLPAQVDPRLAALGLPAPLQPKVGVDDDGQVAWVTMMSHRVEP
jgi:hypothetical protein